MGYVHDTSMIAGVAIGQVTFSGGTWSDVALAGNVWCKRRTASDAAFTVRIPINLPQSGAPGKGAWLRAVEVFYKISTGALDGLSAAIYANPLPVHGAAFGAAQAQAFSYDAAHDTAGERVTLDEHRMTLTLVTPLRLEGDTLAHVELAGDGSTLGSFELYAVQAHYTLRL